MPKVNRLDIVIVLLEEAKTEKDLLVKFDKEYLELPPLDTPNRGDRLYQFYKKWDKIRRKSVVNDNIKMARRLLLEEYV